MVAAAGDIDVQALSNSIKVLAKLDITQSANRITISAKEELVINGGGSFAKFKAGSIELGTSGTFTAHAATHSLPGPKTLSVNNALTAANIGTLIAPGQPPKELVESSAWVEFKLVNADGPIPSEKYILTDPDGGKHTGNVDDQGAARIERIPAGRCKVEFPDLGYSVEVGTT
jgi:type VI secretion system secreted protein VgrG